MAAIAKAMAKGYSTVVPVAPEPTVLKPVDEEFASGSIDKTKWDINANGSEISISDGSLLIKSGSGHAELKMKQRIEFRPFALRFDLQASTSGYLEIDCGHWRIILSDSFRLISGCNTLMTYERWRTPNVDPGAWYRVKLLSTNANLVVEIDRLDEQGRTASAFFTEKAKHVATTYSNLSFSCSDGGSYRIKSLRFRPVPQMATVRMSDDKTTTRGAIY